MTNTYSDTNPDSRHIYFASPEANGTTGTQSDPMNLDTALATAKEGDFVYLEGGTCSLS